jgi:S1-C subfamily serine protease
MLYDPDVHGDAERTVDAPVHPWARFWARSVDLGLFYALAVLAVSDGYGWVAGPSRLLVSILTPLAWTLPEALFLSSIRTTPGKWALGLRVETGRGERLTFGAAWKRSVQVWLRGLGMGIPIISLFTMGHAYAVLVRERQASWDAEDGTRVRARAWSQAFRAVAAATAVTAATLLCGLATQALPRVDLAGEARQALADHRTQTEHWAGKSGAILEPISEVRSGALEVEAMDSFEFHLDAGERAVVLAACDLDCYDLDLAVVSPAGDTLSFDSDIDAWPFVSVRAEEPGDYVATVILYECEAEPCWYAAQAFRSTRSGPWTSTGTCFAVGRDGILVTALHVVEDADRVRVTFTDGGGGDAEVIAEDADHDVAILRTRAVPPEVLGLGGPDDARLGTHVFTIGFPATDVLGTEPKYTEGAIAALSGFQDDEGLLQVSVPIQPGNSGGPLVDESGRVLGVIDATATPRAFEAQTGTFPQNVNWATKTEHVAPLLGGLPPPPPPVRSRDEAVARALGAVCYVEAEAEVD